jgi:hypothetical protein
MRTREQVEADIADVENDMAACEQLFATAAYKSWAEIRETLRAELDAIKQKESEG